MKNNLIIGIIILTLAFVLWIYFYAFSHADEKINSFDDCANAGYPVMESYPRQCKSDSRTFVE